jgi:hypothetical protein
MGAGEWTISFGYRLEALRPPLSIGPSVVEVQSKERMLGCEFSPTLQKIFRQRPTRSNWR